MTPTRRERYATLLEEAQRAKAAAQFEDMGEDGCETCRRARFRAAFRKPGTQRRRERPS